VRIEILGGGCANCKKLEENAREAVKKARKEAEFIKVTDFKEISAYGVMRTPALVIDGKLMTQGRIPSVDEIIKML
jgi:small redox-active disulfide protein 2